MHQRPRILKFLPTLKADLVRPLRDRKHTTQAAMMAAEDKPEDPEQGFHRDALCLPLRVS